MLNFLRIPTPKAIRERQMADAQRQVLECEANAEHFAALASMYRTRLTRLNNTVEMPLLLDVPGAKP